MIENIANFKIHTGFSVWFSEIKALKEPVFINNTEWHFDFLNIFLFLLENYRFLNTRDHTISRKME